MSYANPDILTIPIPTGLDRVINSLQEDLAAISWLQKSFGRAWTFLEKETRDDGGDFFKRPTLKVPKAYSGEGEYYNVLPNDHLESQSFIAAASEEKWPSFTRTNNNPKERALDIIFWFNLKSIDPDKDYIFTEELKTDVEKVLRANEYTQSINQFFDEKPEDVFAGYDISKESEFLMYPYSGFRFNITVGYSEEC